MVRLNSGLMAVPVAVPVAVLVAALMACGPARAVDFTAVVHVADGGELSVRLPDGQVAGALGEPDFLLNLEPGDRLFWRVVAAPGVNLEDWRIGITDIADFWGVIGRWGLRPRRDSRLATAYHVAPIWPTGPSGEEQYLQTSDHSMPPAEMNFRVYCWPSDLGEGEPTPSVRGYVALDAPGGS